MPRKYQIDPAYPVSVEEGPGTRKRDLSEWQKEALAIQTQEFMFLKKGRTRSDGPSQGLYLEGFAASKRLIKETPSGATELYSRICAQPGQQDQPAGRSRENGTSCQRAKAQCK
nr:hypothetical protein [Desulfobacterales bacterium]